MKNVLKNIDYDKYYKQLAPYLEEEKNKKYLFLALTFGASIFFLLFAISPTLSTIANLKKQIVDSKFVDSKLQQKIQSLSSLSRSYEEISQDLSYITNAVPKKPEATNLTAQIQSVADDAGVIVSSIEIGSIDLSAPSQTSTSASLTFALTSQGNYDSTKAFLNGLINMQRVISIDSISISKGKDTSSGSTLQLNIKGSAYYKP